MNNPTRALIVIGLAGLVVSVVAVKHRPGNPVPSPSPSSIPPVATEALPRLVDLGADKCIPCKKMAPILEELREEFAGTFDVEFIDVWKNPDAATPFGIRLIPTQIFFDAAGNELFRHEGFFGREEILATWNEHGVPCGAPP